jgi:uncharacterized protein YqgC (DUF456 family)
MNGLEVLVALGIAVGLVGILVPVLPGSLLVAAARMPKPSSITMPSPTAFSACTVAGQAAARPRRCHWGR